MRGHFGSAHVLHEVVLIWKIGTLGQLDLPDHVIPINRCNFPENLYPLNDDSEALAQKAQVWSGGEPPSSHTAVVSLSTTGKGQFFKFTC